MSENGDGTNKGTVEQVIGVVIDAVFPEKLPEIYSALKIEIPEGDGRDRLCSVTCWSCTLTAAPPWSIAASSSTVSLVWRCSSPSSGT